MKRSFVKLGLQVAQFLLIVLLLLMILGTIDWFYNLKDISFYFGYATQYLAFYPFSPVGTVEVSEGWLQLLTGLRIVLVFLLLATTNIALASHKHGGFKKYFALLLSKILPKKEKKPKQRKIKVKKKSLPPLSLLLDVPFPTLSAEDKEEVSAKIDKVFSELGINIEVKEVAPGPTVTTYGIEPGMTQGRGGKETRVPVRTVMNSIADLQLGLATKNLRLEPVLDDKSLIGLELPNKKQLGVGMYPLVASSSWGTFSGKAELPVVLGLSKTGEPIFVDLASTPHMLVAGTTGSGKSVFINTLICSLLLSRYPHQVQMIMVDPKRVELSRYSKLPHLSRAVLTDLETVPDMLNSVVEVMDHRYELLELGGKRNIVEYNKNRKNKLPYILIIIDELADLMLKQKDGIEPRLVRLAQLGRASGIHLVLATQRPSVNVITGIMKANFPTRISFALKSQVDSRTILDELGAEKLVGKGDMLWSSPGSGGLQRIQGVFITDSEVDALIKHWS